MKENNLETVTKRKTKAAKSLEPTDMVDNYDNLPMKEKYKTRIALMQSPKNLSSMTDIVAKDFLSYRGYLVRELKEVFFMKAHMWHVDKYYPEAFCGPLLIDEPRTKQELADCLLKKEALKKLGKKYLIIETGTTIEQVAEALDVDPVIYDDVPAETKGEK